MKKHFIGFDIANQFIRSIDRISLILILEKNGANIGKNCNIETGLTFHNCTNYSNLIIGNNCHIGKNCFFDLKDKIIISDNVVVSMQCIFITHIDITKSGLSQFYKSTAGRIIIEHDCYIGANSTLLMNTTLGHHSFIAAGSVITKKVAPYNLVGGVPAKLIKKIK